MSIFESIIQELTVKDLKKDFKGKTRPHAGIVDRSKPIGSHLQEVTEKGIMRWKSDAITTEGVSYWNQEVVLVDFNDALKMTDLNFMERANLAVFGDIKVKCSCPAYLYWGYDFITTQLDSNAGKGENRSPNIRNPHLEGVVCKHLVKVLEALPFHINDVAKKMKEIGKPKGENIYSIERNYMREQRGLGMGVGGPRQGDGGASECTCPECGYTQVHERGIPCSEITCPECGAMMVGSNGTFESIVEALLESGGDGTGPPGGVGRGLGPGGGRMDGSGLGKGGGRPFMR